MLYLCNTESMEQTVDNAFNNWAKELKVSSQYAHPEILKLTLLDEQIDFAKKEISNQSKKEFKWDELTKQLKGYLSILLGHQLR